MVRGQLVAVALAVTCLVPLTGTSAAWGHDEARGEPNCSCSTTPTPHPTTTVLGETLEQPGSGNGGNVPARDTLLPLTGADIAVLAVAGFALIGSGGAFVFSARESKSRRRR